MGHLSVLIAEHKKNAEKIRVDAANMFFTAKEQRNLDKRRAAVNNTYQHVLFFLFQHNELAALINASIDTVEESEIMALNNLITLMAAIIDSFPELGVNDCGITTTNVGSEEKMRRYSI